MEIIRLSLDALNRYPAKFSGGQRQRICIARAWMGQPKALTADEAVSALDVSVQKEVLRLLRDIRDEMGLTELVITHDFRVVAQICYNVIVMQRGEVVEHGPIARVFDAPEHPYTRMLLDAQPGKHWHVPDISTLPPVSVA